MANFFNTNILNLGNESPHESIQKVTNWITEANKQTGTLSIKWQDDTMGEFETEPGYHFMKIKGNTLLIQDEIFTGDIDYDDLSYHIVPIYHLEFIQIIKH